MRAILDDNQRDMLFGQLKKNIGTWKTTAESQNISVRTLTDWRRGKYSMPAEIMKSFLEICNLKIEDIDPVLVPEYWHIKEAAKKGARVRMELYGDIGTPEGRRLGGINSAKLQALNGSNFKTKKEIKKPRKSKKLAELLGILMGDGHLSSYQVLMTTNATTDREHAIYTQRLIKELFDIQSTIIERKADNTVRIIASSVSMVEYLNRYGMPIGNKISKGLNAPDWILKKRTYKEAFIRGLFDTDGCIYLDNHIINNKKYVYYGWAFTSYVEAFLVDILQILKELGFHPTNQKSQRSVFLRRGKEIEKYFKEIGTSNPKHKNRYNGRVPKWS